MSILKSRRFWLVVLAALVVSGTAVALVVRPIFFGTSGPAAPKEFRQAAGARPFVEMTRQAGFTHVHHKPTLDKKLAPIMSWVASVGAAAAAGDFDGDGWVDLYVTDSAVGEPNRLYRNLGNGRFEDVAEKAGVARANDRDGTSMDCVWGDYDNDGRLDLYVAKWGRDILYHNNGDGTFSDVTARAFRDEQGRPGAPWANACAAVWVDYDLDGRLDLYVGNYFAPFDLWNLETTKIMHDDFEKARNAGRNFLYHNNGDGSFTEVAGKLGLDDPGWTLAVGAADINNDGWPDIYCADDFGPDQLFLNRGDGTFRDATEQSIGVDSKKGMNIDFGDIDGDGWLDMYVANITTKEYLKEGNMLWHNDAADKDGTPIFMDIGQEAGAYDGGWGWGAKFWDFDNDGDLDIIAVNGFITAGEGSYWYDLASWTVTGQDVSDAANWPPIGDRSFSGHEPDRLWRNDGNKRFSEIAAQAGVADQRDGRGAVLLDYDNDGDLDLYVANQGAAGAFYRNDVGSSGHWLALKLSGSVRHGSNRGAVGARVTIVTPSGQQIRELDGGNSYCGQSDQRVFFGLGDDLTIDTLEIRWPSRRVQQLKNVRTDQLLVVSEPDELPQVASLIPTSRDPGKMPLARPTAGPKVKLPPEERARILGQVEEKIRKAPDDVALASRYRVQCVALGEYERSVKFFERLAGEAADVKNVRLQLAASYVDKIPTCGGMAAIVSKGTLARQSLDQTDILIKADDQWWPGVYCRAMNHLHWPRSLRHSADAAKDFRRCIELQKKEGNPAARSYYVRSYIGLGDALAKDGKFTDAQAAWKEGLAAFPADAELKKRLALKTAAEAEAFIESTRNLEQQIDTDFSFLLAP